MMKSNSISQLARSISNGFLWRRMDSRKNLDSRFNFYESSSDISPIALHVERDQYKVNAKNCFISDQNVFNSRGLTDIYGSC